MKQSELIRIHGTSNPILKLFNGLRYFSTMLFAPGRISRMQSRVSSAEALLETKVVKNESCQQRYQRIDAYLPELNKNWADGVACGATSATWMLVAMKLLAKEVHLLWAPENVSLLSKLLACQVPEDLESADALHALERVIELLVGPQLGKKEGLLVGPQLRHKYNERVTDLLAGYPPNKALDWLRSDESGDVGEEWSRLLKRHLTLTLTLTLIGCRGFSKDTVIAV